MVVTQSQPIGVQMQDMQCPGNKANFDLEAQKPIDTEAEKTPRCALHDMLDTMIIVEGQHEGACPKTGPVGVLCKVIGGFLALLSLFLTIIGIVLYVVLLPFSFIPACSCVTALLKLVMVLIKIPVAITKCFF